jgi:hypothetical protein
MRVKYVLVSLAAQDGITPPIHCVHRFARELGDLAVSCGALIFERGSVVV